MRRRRIVFILEEFILGAPSQQLLDRFLIGYTRDGEFRRSEWEVVVWLAPAAENSTAYADATNALAARQRDFNLRRELDLATALKDADAVVVVAAPDRVAFNEAALSRVIEIAPAGTVCFVHGALAAKAERVRQLVAAASTRKIVLVSGTSVATTFRLPEIEIPAGASIAEALIVVQGPRPLAELAGISGLAPILAHRAGGESGIRALQRHAGERVWRAAKDRQWSWPLLAAAISRSNTTQGDPVRDGRTQDLAGLGLLPKLARAPRGWTIEHHDGVRSTVLVLDGAVADINFAVRWRDGTIVSAQLYRPPPPQRAEFDRLAAALDALFATRQRPWPTESDLLVSDFMARVQAAADSP